MAKFDFNAAQVKKQAKQLEEVADKLTSGSIKKIDNANQAIAAAWTGTAADAFGKFMKELNTNLTSNASSVRELANVLNETCKIMQQAEADAKTKTASN